MDQDLEILQQLLEDAAEQMPEPKYTEEFSEFVVQDLPQMARKSSTGLARKSAQDLVELGIEYATAFLNQAAASDLAPEQKLLGLERAHTLISFLNSLAHSDANFIEFKGIIYSLLSQLRDQVRNLGLNGEGKRLMVLSMASNYEVLQRVVPEADGLSKAWQAYQRERQRKVDFVLGTPDNSKGNTPNEAGPSIGSMKHRDGLEGRLSFFKGFC